MGDSSDEDFNSDDEFIDLKALWRDPIFLDEPETEDPDISSAEDDLPPRVIELTPYVSTPEGDADPLENLMNEITDMSRRVTNARYLNRLQAARQRIMDLGRPVIYRCRPVEEDMTTSSPSTPQVMWSTNAGPTRYHDDQSVDDEQVPYRFNQFRHMVAGNAPIPPRWARGRQTFSVLSHNVGRMVDSSTQDEDETKYVDATESEPHFILPGAIQEREKDEGDNEVEIDEEDLTQRALFVSEIVFSSLMRHNEAQIRYPIQSTYSAYRASKNKNSSHYDYSQPNSSEDSADEYADPDMGPFPCPKF